MMLLPNTLSAADYYHLRAFPKPVMVCLFGNPQWIFLSSTCPDFPWTRINSQQWHSLARSSIAPSTAWRSNLFYLFSSWFLWLSFNSPSSHMKGTVRSQSLFVVSIHDFVSLHHILPMPVFQADKSLPTQLFLVWKLPRLLLLLSFSQRFSVEVKPLRHEGKQNSTQNSGCNWTMNLWYNDIFHFVLYSFSATSQGLTAF